MKTDVLNRKEIDVIVVDDETDLCFMMQAILKSSGFSVKGLTDAANLDNMLVEYNPKVLVLDLQLQSFNGATICEKLISENTLPTSKILLISASYNGLENATNCGANAFLEKPFGIKEFESKIVSLIEESAPAV